MFARAATSVARSRDPIRVAVQRRLEVQVKRLADLIGDERFEVLVSEVVKMRAQDGLQSA